MELEDVIEYLKDLGLGEYQSKVFATLALKGPMKAIDAARESGVPQSKIYWALEHLISKQLVEVLEGRPKEYKAVDAEIGIRSIIDSHEKKLSRHKDLQKEVVNFLRSERSGGTLDGIWTIRGRHFREFFNKTAEMIDRSSRYVFGVTRDFSKSVGLSDAVRGAIKRGVKIRVIGIEKVNQSNFLNTKWYADHGIEMKFIETKLHPRIVLIDGKEVLLRLDHNHEKKVGFTFSSIWSQDPSLVKVFDSYIKNLWSNAKTIDAVAFGRNLLGKYYYGKVGRK